MNSKMEIFPLYVGKNIKKVIPAFKYNPQTLDH